LLGFPSTSYGHYTEVSIYVIHQGLCPCVVIWKWIWLGGKGIYCAGSNKIKNKKNKKIKKYNTFESHSSQIAYSSTMSTEHFASACTVYVKW